LGETRLRKAYVAAKLNGVAQTQNSGAPDLAKAADPAKAGSVSFWGRFITPLPGSQILPSADLFRPPFCNS